MKNAKSNASDKPRYVLAMSSADKVATITLDNASARSGSDETVFVATGGSEERAHRGRSLAMHITDLLNEHPHEWPKKRAKKSKDT